MLLFSCVDSARSIPPRHNLRRSCRLPCYSCPRYRMEPVVEPEPLVAANPDRADANDVPVDLDRIPLVLQDLIRSYLPPTGGIGAQADSVDSFFNKDAQWRM